MNAINTQFTNALNTAVANAPVTAQTPEQAVDRLAFLKSAIAALREEEDACKGILIASGLRAVESDFYRATVAEVSESTTTDWKSLALSFKPSGQKLCAYTEKKAGYFRIDVRAKKTS